MNKNFCDFFLAVSIKQIHSICTTGSLNNTFFTLSIKYHKRCLQKSKIGIFSLSSSIFIPTKRSKITAVINFSIVSRRSDALVFNVFFVRFSFETRTQSISALFVIYGTKLKQKISQLIRVKRIKYNLIKILAVYLNVTSISA